MKSLLQCCGTAIVVGIDTRAFLINGDEVTELKDDKPTTGGDSKPESKDVNHKGIDPLEIQCVAISRDADDTIWCAVSRYDKSLAIYRDSKVEVVHTTNKRSGCLTFAWKPVGMILAGDLVGDATAFPLTNNKKGRLLLGHTASMLTGIRLVGDTLLTADRDEKVRVSSFPQTCIVRGYLLGHAAFLCSMDIATDDLCVTCGGDYSVRLWKLSTFTQLASVETEGLLPTQVSTDGERVAVIFHNSNTIHIYSLMTLELLQTLDSSAQPLGISLQDSDMFVLSKEPCLLQAYKLVDGKYESTTDDRFSSLNTQLIDATLPSSILEADKTTGQLKLGKVQEHRSANPADIPWNRVDRIAKSKESRNRRNKKRKVAAESS